MLDLVEASLSLHLSLRSFPLSHDPLSPLPAKVEQKGWKSCREYILSKSGVGKKKGEGWVFIPWELFCLPRSRLSALLLTPSPLAQDPPPGTLAPSTNRLIRFAVEDG